jgi:hypothetical protein
VFAEADVKNGMGRYTSANKTYEGEWKDNQRSGFGIAVTPKGEKYEGMWER